MMNKDISANFHRKCLILCSTNLLCVLHNTDLTVLLSWQHTGFQMLMIFEANLLASRNQVGGDWKRVSCKGSRFFIAEGCVSCRTISLTSFNGLRCKLAKIALYIYLIQYWVECMTSSVISFAYFTEIRNLNISGTNKDIFYTNVKRCFYPFTEFYVIHLKNPGVKI